MMNVLKKNGIKPFVCFFLICVFWGCSKNNMEEMTVGSPVSVTLSATVSRIQTRVNGSSFDNEDQIGLFILEQPNKLVDERHADNVRFTYDMTNWIAEKEVFYPQGDSKSTFLAYYPYQSTGILPGTSVLNCKIKTDQSIGKNYSLSDFLVATLSDVTPGVEAVPLNFKHKLTAIEFVLEPGDAYPSAQELLNANPVVMIKDVCITSEYDFATKTFTHQADKSDVIPAGEFIVKENKLIGKKCVIVPQTISAGHILVELSTGNKNYIFTLGDACQFDSGTRHTYTLTLHAAAPENIPGEITTSVSEWENDLNQFGELMEKKGQDGIISDSYSVSIPDFSVSSVYRVMNGKTQIAEICREYLVTKDIDNQAIVLYPMKERTIDYTHGTVLQILENNAGKALSGMVHGGTLSWDNNSGSLTYSKGSLQALTSVYLDAKGAISNTPNGKVLAASTLEPEVLSMPGDPVKYPLVKIGTQYWIKQNLKSIFFTDNSSIPLKEGASEWKTASKAYCHYKETDEILYKYQTVLENMEPTGWKIPTKSDWNKLMLYVNWNSILLEDASWEVADRKLNLTGFSANKTGLRLPDGTFYENSPGFWHCEGGYTCFVNALIKIYDNEVTSGCSLRLVRR